MDDGSFGADTIEEAKLLCKEVEFVLEQGGFALKGWSSNEKALEAYMNANSKGVKILGEDDETKILGLCWLKASDEFAVFTRQLDTNAKMTKRNVLSEILKLHDPNGYVSPIIVKAKMLMQDIWKLNNKDKKKKDKIDWDDELPDDIKNQWQKYRSEFPLLSNFHAFCDACSKAYGVTIFVRVLDEHQKVCVSLLSSKSRVAPLIHSKEDDNAMPSSKSDATPQDDEFEEPTTPRLELLAAVMVTLWSDSIIVG